MEAGGGKGEGFYRSLVWVKLLRCFIVVMLCNLLFAYDRDIRVDISC